jgi:hypothetical protein
VLSLADVVRQHGPGYQARFSESLLPSHARALRDILHCRTQAMGGHLVECTRCTARHLVYHSCRNRACSRCGAERASHWVARQRDLLLPVTYFHVVFTVPAQLRDLVRRHQKRLLPVLFRAAFESLSALCTDPRRLGGKIGALAVLHTWTRTLEWHPHVHLLVPGGALSPEGTWLPTRRTRHGQPYLVPVHALSVKFWGRFLALARKAVPNELFPDMPRRRRWVVHAKPALQGSERVLEYLGRYIHRTAIADGAFVNNDPERVSFRYRDSRDGRTKTMTLAGAEFLRRFLQHVPPRGVHRVRAFGLLHPSHRATLRRLQLLLGGGGARRQTNSPEPSTTSPRCEHCGATTWRRGARLSPEQCVAVLSRLSLAAAARAPPEDEHGP